MRFTGRKLVVAFVLAFGLLAPIALIMTTTVDAQSPAAQKNPARSDCLRNGGWWERIMAVCQYGAAAVTKKASAYDQAKKACESKGGWFEPALAMCEFEASAKTYSQAAAYDQMQKACLQQGGWWDPVAAVCDTGN